MFNFFNTQTQTVKDTEKSLLNIYGYSDSNHFNLPDYREVALVGAGTNVIDKKNGNLTTHDIYTVGEFKDDQLQRHDHKIGISQHPFTSNKNSAYAALNEFVYYSGYTNDGYDGRFGTTTHGKRKGIKYIIKVL